MTTKELTDLAHQTQLQVESLRKEMEFVKKELEKGDYPAVRERLADLEARVAAQEKLESEVRRVSLLDDRIAKLEARTADADRLQQRVAVLEEQAAEFKKWREQSEQRRWQFVFLTWGGFITILLGVATIIVNLVLAFVRK
jgi:uncharacterized coiled-coil protein SlyX